MPNTVWTNNTTGNYTAQIYKLKTSKIHYIKICNSKPGGQNPHDDDVVTECMQFSAYPRNVSNISKRQPLLLFNPPR